jgi:hypothetical protein
MNQRNTSVSGIGLPFERVLCEEKEKEKKRKKEKKKKKKLA